MATWRRIVFALVLSLAAWAAASAREKPHVWFEVRSPHFQVVSNADAKQAGKVADQFERIRSVFHAAFPGMSVDPAAPMTILAIKDEKTFKTLVPESWLEKGQLQRSGMFLGGMDRNYVLLRLETGEEDPYAALYHEYTHLLLHQNSLTIPTWMDEGLAEFYAHSEIHEKEVWLGRPSKSHVYILRETKLIPLSTLFSVDYTSPYYNEQNKGTIFYAESWALVHYLMLKDTMEGGHRMGEFAKLLRDGLDAVTAAGRAFGDSSELQKELENYLQQPIFSYLKMKTATEVDDSVFQTRELPLVESSTVRGDFLAHNGNYGAAKDVLDSALRADSTYAPARESMGLVEFYQSHRDEAKKWFAEAVKLNSKSYLAHYYYGVMSLNEKLDDSQATDVESSLRRAIQINPTFAPTYDALAIFLAMRRQDLDEARMLELRAISLDPSNVQYLVNSGGILLALGRVDDAVRVGEHALKVAKTSELRQVAENYLDGVRKQQQYLATLREPNKQAGAPLGEPTVVGEENAAATPEGPQQAEQPSSKTATPIDEASLGPRDSVEGWVSDVKCSAPAVFDLTLETDRETMNLHAENYFRVAFGAIDFTPTGELNPCTDLKGRRARVVFRSVRGRRNSGVIVSVLLRKRSASRP